MVWLPALEFTMPSFALRAGGFAFLCTAGGCGGSSSVRNQAPFRGDASTSIDSSVNAFGACFPGDAAVMPPALETDAAAAAGPYRWTSVTITAGGFVSGVVFSPAQRDLVYARTDIGGAYRYDATAGRWIPLLDWIGRDHSDWMGVESIAPDPLDPRKVYIAAGTYVTSGNGVILRSSDQGQTFQIGKPQIPMGGNNDGRSVGERLAIDPNRTSTLYFGSRTTGLWRSTDAAMTLTQVTSLPGLVSAGSGATAAAATTPNGVGIPFVLFDPTTCASGAQTTAYAAVAVPGASLYRSTDGGDTWAAVPGEPTGLLPSHAAISATGMLYVTYGGGTGINGDGPNNVTNGAVYRLDTRRGTWTNVTPVAPGTPPFGYAGVSVDATHPGSVVVSTIDRWGTDDVFRSTDSGATWSAVGIPKAMHDVSAAPWVTFHQASPNYTGWMGDVEIDPFRPDRILHITGQGIWASDDFTAVDSNQPTHWDFRSQGIEETAVLDLASPPSGPHLLSAVGDIGGFRHDDLGVSPAGGMSDNPRFASTDSIDYAEQNPNLVARVGRGGARTSPHGAYSTDGGTTWLPFPTTLPIANGSAGSIAISADGSTFVWDPPASTAAASPGGPRYSHDSGRTWTPSTGIGAVRPVIADRVNSMKFYAFDGAAGAVLASTDQAATFSQTAARVPGGGSGQLRATPGIEGDLWLVANGGLYHSTDGATTFAVVSTASGVFALGLGMAQPGQAYPALYLGGIVNQVDGIFRSDDQGASFTRIDDDRHRFGTATVIVGDPRVYGRVYIGTNGRGIFYGDLTSP
jgi:xyloglucan-specific exo-beta-1,4-glucanase